MNTTTTTTQNLSQLMGYTLTDSQGNKIGDVDGVWAEPTTGALAFLGVKTTPIVGKTHVVPADQAQIDNTNQTITVPYSENSIKNAPTCDTSSAIPQTDQDSIRSYYQNAQSPQPGTTVSSTPSAVPISGTSTSSPGSYPVDNVTYDLYTLISEKLKGMEAYDTYLQDAQSDQGLSALLRQLRQQDTQGVQQLQQYLVQRLTGQSG